MLVKNYLRLLLFYSYDCDAMPSGTESLFMPKLKDLIRTLFRAVG